MAENEVRRDLATWPAGVDKRLDPATVRRAVEQVRRLSEIAAETTASIDALADRVSALETASAKCPSAPMPPRARAMPYEGDTMTHEAAPSPPAPLVERMAEAMFNVRHPGTIPWERVGKAVQDEYRTDARAALRVAAEGLLYPRTGEEEDAFEDSTKCNVEAIDDLIRARLAAALEACR